MKLDGSSAVVTGGASGLGLATVRRLLKEGPAAVVIADLPTSAGAAVAAELGERAFFVPADVRSADDLSAVFDAAEAQGPLRAVVHCAGRGGPVRVVDKKGEPGSLELYTEIVTINLIGSFNVLRFAAARMAGNEPVDGDRGVVILTASVAAFEGQIGQIPYASSKAGIVGMTIVAARDLASRQIRVNTIAPGTFDTRCWPDSPTMCGPRWRLRCRIRADSAIPTSMRSWHRPSSTTACSTARRSGSTEPSGWPPVTTVTGSEVTAGVQVDIDSHIAVIAINRPAVRNAIDFDTATAIATALDDVEAAVDVRAIIITGRGDTSAPAWISRRIRRAVDDRSPRPGAFGIVEQPPAKP